MIDLDSNRALVIGGDALLGRAISIAAQGRGIDVTNTTRRHFTTDPQAIPLDLTDANAVEALTFPPPPCRAYLLAAVTSLRACREQPQDSEAINVDAIGRLAERTAECGATPVLVSTNLVFDGTRANVPVGHPTEPQAVYGQQKARAERKVLDARGVVVRPTKILPQNPPMLATWLDRLRNGEHVEAFTDLWFSPVPMSAVTDALLSAPPGVHHVSGDRDISYYETALHLAVRVGADPALVIPAQAQDAGIPSEERPRHTTLSCPRPFDVWDVLDASLDPA